MSWLFGFWICSQAGLELQRTLLLLPKSWNWRRVPSRLLRETSAMLGDRRETFNPCPQVCGAAAELFLLCWVSHPQQTLTMPWASRAASLLAGSLAGSQGHTREFDDHCLAGLAGRAVVGPCWGQGKPGSVLISDVLGVQELFVGSASLTPSFTACRFSCCQKVTSLGLAACHKGQVVFRTFWNLGQEPLPAVLRPTSTCFGLKGA